MNLRPDLASDYVVCTCTTAEASAEGEGVRVRESSPFQKSDILGIFWKIVYKNYIKHGKRKGGIGIQVLRSGLLFSPRKIILPTPLIYVHDENLSTGEKSPVELFNRIRYVINLHRDL